MINDVYRLRSRILAGDSMGLYARYLQAQHTLHGHQDMLFPYVTYSAGETILDPDRTKPVLDVIPEENRFSRLELTGGAIGSKPFDNAKASFIFFGVGFQAVNPTNYTFPDKFITNWFEFNGTSPSALIIGIMLYGGNTKLIFNGLDGININNTNIPDSDILIKDYSYGGYRRHYAYTIQETDLTNFFGKGSPRVLYSGKSLLCCDGDYIWRGYPGTDGTSTPIWELLATKQEFGSDKLNLAFMAQRVNPTTMASFDVSFITTEYTLDDI